MTKTSDDVLLNEISKDFNSYLKSGVMDITPFAQDIDPNLNINNIKKLLRIHFILTPEVIEFITCLSSRLRRIKTIVTKEEKELKDFVTGRIDWPKTMRSRYSTNPKDNSLFVCSLPRENYDIDENIVLKTLLKVVHKTVHIDLKPAIDSNYSWLDDWTERKKLREILHEVYSKNVYIRRISDDKLTPTERMIRATMCSRNALYRDAARLLQRYNKLTTFDFDQNEAKALLKNTFIKPDKTEVLFELYWVFKILGSYKDVKFNIIENEARGLVAQWTDTDNVYSLYHNSTGSFRFFEAFESLNEPKRDGYLAREAKSVKKVVDLGYKAFGITPNDGLWGGRPDILIEKRRKATNKITSLFIGEVKYTDNKGYALTGLRELLEYMALIKEGTHYYTKLDEVFTSPNVSGCLFVDNLDGFEDTHQGTISIKCFGHPVENLAI
jgi:hypothetical protein